ncbi:hypothetical protein LHYA1_G003187 [Lachnellula hyalina]|uniref:Uncharacterized protein n=1 Tax=Lachnellula hyalina TaxID=1316788 RepID=A0A8H8R2S3_9HELO|nr:uncharacterized protein LHYA1_G003187 [Lachnellula hyalina]TVY27467.1 hypothetical protein LHYA1_G003187 [Lachnellula hyalina]
MSPTALGTTVGRIKKTLYSDLQKYVATPSAEDESFLATGGMDLSEDGSKFEETKYFIPTSRRRCNFTTIIAVVSSVLAAILLFTVAALLDHSHPSINYVPAITDNVQVGGWPLVEAGGNVIVDCGGTPAEAKDRGCVWDLMSFSWTHPACYNKNESETFLAEYGPWKWYENVDNKPGAEVLDESDLPYMSMVWTQEHYHIAHCTYILKLLHLAAMSGHLVTDEGIGMFHTDHCVKVFLDPERVVFEKVTTRVQLLYGKCVTIRDVN